MEEEVSKLDLSRQSKLVPQDEITQWNIYAFGVGSIGSHVVKLLGKTGFQNIKVFDMDKVESENLAPQAFDYKHVGKTKVDAIKDILKESCNLTIETHHGQVTKETNIPIEPKTIYCCFFDSIEARRLVFDKVKDYPVVFVDSRIGKHNMRYYMIDCSNEEDKKAYEKTLYTGKMSDLKCGEKASAPINLELTGKIVSNMILYIAGNSYVKSFVGNTLAPANHITILKRREDKLTDEDEEESTPEETPVEEPQEEVQEEVQPVETEETIEGIETTEPTEDKNV